MSPSLRHPLGRLRVADKVEQPAQESEAVLPPESELRGVRAEGVRERAGVVVGTANCVGDDVGYRLGVLAVGEQVSRNARRPGDGQAAGRGPFAVRHLAVMETHVGPTRLPPGGQGEFMPVSRQVAEAVHSRGRPVRDDTLGGSALPGEDIGCELKPGRTELGMVRRRRTREAVHALSHPLEHRFRSQALKRGRRDARSFSLAAGHEPPLILSDLCETVECGVPCHYCILAHN
jgi:hypothetical protein